MTEPVDLYGRTLKRLLHELRYTLSERNALNELARVAPRTSWGFFSYAYIALYNDLFSHAIKILDRNKDSATFWHIHKNNKNDVETTLKLNGLDVVDVESLTNKLKVIRDKTHFHIDKKSIFSPKDVWKEADISGNEFNKVFDKLWLVLNSLHQQHFGEQFTQPIYQAKEIESLITMAKKNDIMV